MNNPWHELTGPDVRLIQGDEGELVTEHRIVDFHSVHTVPRAFLDTLVAERAAQRLKLLPPYREHLSQSFARFFTRVGLPTPITRDW